MTMEGGALRRLNECPMTQLANGGSRSSPLHFTARDVSPLHFDALTMAPRKGSRKVTELSANLPGFASRGRRWDRETNCRGPSKMDAGCAPFDLPATPPMGAQRRE